MQNNYKLPPIECIIDDDSKSIIEYISKIKEYNQLMIPIGLLKQEILLEEINKMPNYLIGGTVMSGKTSYINAILASVLMSKTPNEVGILLCSSRPMEYNFFNGIPHLISPVISDIKKFSLAMQKLRIEIDKRKELLMKNNLKNIDAYNKQVSESEIIKDLVVVIDDYSTFGNFNDVNDSILYITSEGWVVNVYVILVAANPSSEVIPALSKTNFPARLSFRVASSQASRMIIDDVGAEKLAGYGEALYISRFYTQACKVKVPFITDEDLSRIIEYWKNEYQSVYSEDFYESVINDNTNFEQEDAPLYNEVVEFAIQMGYISASLIQRKFRVGYNKAALLIDRLEEEGVIGHQNGSKPREVLKEKDNEKESN